MNVLSKGFRKFRRSRFKRERDEINSWTSKITNLKSYFSCRTISKIVTSYLTINKIVIGKPYYWQYQITITLFLSTKLLSKYPRL